ncbi:MAG TPA: hypothetical protein DCY33_01365 [Gemmatimonadetes bacterium]|nr:hypothetical protein [Gemmatimonadota bacterium]
MNGLARWRQLVWVSVLMLFTLHFVLHIGLSYGREAPDFLTLGLLIAARELSLSRAAGLGLVAGLLEDAMSLLAFGANSIAMTLVATGGSVTRDLFVGDSRLFFPAYIFAGKWTRDLIHWLAMGPEVRHPFIEQAVLEGMLGALYVAGIAIVFSIVRSSWSER